MSMFLGCFLFESALLAVWSRDGDVPTMERSRFYFSPGETARTGYVEMLFDPRGPPARTTFPCRPSAELLVPT